MSTKRDNLTCSIDKLAAIANMRNHVILVTGNINAVWQGRLTAAQQRDMYGMYLGKGLITIDTRERLLVHTVRVGFDGGEIADTYVERWDNLGTPYVD